MTKDTTFKLRLTEAEKTAWEAQATADGVSLSSLIRARMNHPTTRADGPVVPVESWWAEHNRRLDGTALIDNALALLSEGRRTAPCEHDRPVYAFCPACDGE